MKILANDGISKNGVEELEAAGFEVSTVTVAQEQLENYINNEGIVALLVRSATTVRKDLIDACPSLKIIGRGGVGMDNIDVEYARGKGLHVINTPAASSESVAELVFAHLFSGVRYLYDANRNMPLDGDSKFKSLKKAYAKGTELRGKTLGVIGFGRIGQATAKIGLGLGMKVIAHDPFMDKASVTVPFFDGQSLTFDIEIQTKEAVLKQADFLSLHVPAQKDFVIGTAELELMKDGAGLVNAARGGVVDEVAMVEALKSGKLSFAGVDTFENEPTPAVQVLMTPNVSLTPHIGAATTQAQERIGSELASQIISILK
ncbi:D-2-hydroxyacid dehydrogenase [Flavobacteriaceae bacterium]|jgi:D-3-phosphoglycerate dehydrogenase|uniref:D-2-hydroxyacid dehydrogenase n=1 Tax=Formosa sp. Hel3_A1_48 TaxID=1336795 RepID=UPI00084E2BA6|nr:D-2-hydroxyacid dehydrogenase [Formosa sp. Hel3_A1_48]MDA9760007.1 D-2-hydroxyacid dehydrogenase [Flavobacteriaceae bacterium]AOR25225.1 3-phosphoglycerate dehydrogenase [Formosa sp. Hel3_A1_48]MDC0371345.1 D-2-hydroxyacid dehydrogenase [Flavobacteriaceae bacterium]MDC0950805.1 D-2-hydroxyacid dehydrogenase [Flavobacteriaceae bacterium]MDG1057156.1 D-2-hydroxyacid dehydrogenase [Flavobacteriaceae bacterium]